MAEQVLINNICYMDNFCGQFSGSNKSEFDESERMSFKFLGLENSETKESKDDEDDESHAPACVTQNLGQIQFVIVIQEGIEKQVIGWFEERGIKPGYPEQIMTNYQKRNKCKIVNLKTQSKLQEENGKKHRDSSLLTRRKKNKLPSHLHLKIGK